VLLTIAADPDIRIRDIADRVGITERAAQLIVADLVEDGYLIRNRNGRRNAYEVDGRQPFRHPAEAAHEVAELIAIFVEQGRTDASQQS
jgi:predicted transcriptional regulator